MQRTRRIGLTVRVALAMVFSTLAVLDVGCAQMMQALSGASNAAGAASGVLRTSGTQAGNTRPDPSRASGMPLPVRKPPASDNPYLATGRLDKDGMPLDRGPELSPEEYNCAMFGTDCPDSAPMPKKDAGCTIRTPEGECLPTFAPGMV